MMNIENGTPAAFLTALGHALVAREGEDTELAKIVSEHILAATPAETCVEQAMAEIDKLAESRATPSGEDADV